MAEYKGIYYDDNSKEKYFEGGAHFRYKQLYKILEKLSAAQKIRLNREKLIKDRQAKKKEKTKDAKKSSNQTSKNCDSNLTYVSLSYFIKFKNLREQKK